MSKIKWHGPYKGSKENGGRPIMVGKVKRDGHWETVSKNAARKEYEDAHHTTLSKDTDVDHKDNGGRKGHDALSNLQAMSHSKNVAKENKRRAHKK
jgi:hypothetical protein